MLPEDLYELVGGRGDDEADLGRPVLVHGLAGFVDAGSAATGAVEHLLASLPSRVVARFDVDLLLDYRARRPPMAFLEDHWESYADPALELHVVEDEAGERFLLLSGPEPDVMWERFVAALQQLVERFDVRTTVGLNAIPMAVPHTRPTGVTAHATRPELVRGYERWVGAVQVPGYAGALLELRLGQAGRDAVGLAVHVPHYLAQTAYPEASATLLEHVSRLTGLALPVEALRTAALEARGEVDAQVARSDEVAAVVAALERQYDAYAGARTRGSLLAQEEADLPSGEELGAELERFLAEQAGDARKDED